MSMSHRFSLLLGLLLLVLLHSPALCWSSASISSHRATALSGANAECDRSYAVQPVKTFDINLDLPPRDRFRASTLYFKDQILEWFFKEKSQFNPIVFGAIEEVAEKALEVIPYPFHDEIEGIADTLGVNRGDVVLATLIYDLTAFCTSIVTQTPSGQILHGRNLDYFFPEQLINMTYIGRFYRNKTLLFTSVQIAGMIGVTTGHKLDHFTFSIDERDQGSLLVNVLAALLDRRASPLFFLTRRVMENATTFEEAIKMLATTDLIAPAYFIVGGVGAGQGAVITRDQFETLDLWRLNATSTGFDHWFLVETNYDHWVEPPANDDRRTPAIRAMNATTQAHIGYESLMDVMSVPRVCNNGTVYSAVMSAADDAESGGFNLIMR